MKLLFDASELTPVSAKSVGIYRYALGLFSEMVRQCGPDDHVALVCNGDNLADFQRRLAPGRVTVVCIQPRMPGHFWRQWWMRLGAALCLRRMGAEAYLSPKGFIPRRTAWPRGVARVAVIHDLIPFWYFKQWPGYFGRMESWLVSGAFEHAFRRADRLIAISEETGRALAEHGVPSRRVSVVLNGVDTAEDEVEAVRSDLPSGVEGRFIFAMASGLPHKNQQGVLAAYAAYRRLAGTRALPLVLCGASDVQQGGVLSVGRVSDKALLALYRYADLFVFLSLMEGFGYPPIEALRVGTPVLCSDLGVLKEVTGGLAYHVAPQAAEEATQAMHRLCDAPWTLSQREVLRTQAHHRITSELSWERCADGVWQALRQGVAATKASMQEQA